MNTKSEEQKMNFKVFEDDVWRTFNPELDVRDSITNAVFGLNGEAGEVADIFKKVWYQGHESSRDKVINELGDVMYYVSLLASLMDSSLEEVVTKNIVKRGKRYPKGFSEKASIERKDMIEFGDGSELVVVWTNDGDL